MQRDHDAIGPAPKCRMCGVEGRAQAQTPGVWPAPVARSADQCAPGDEGGDTLGRVQLVKQARIYFSVLVP